MNGEFAGGVSYGLTRVCAIRHLVIACLVLPQSVFVAGYGLQSNDPSLGLVERLVIVAVGSAMISVCIWLLLRIPVRITITNDVIVLGFVITRVPLLAIANMYDIVHKRTGKALFWIQLDNGRHYFIDESCYRCMPTQLERAFRLRSREVTELPRS